MYIMAQTHDGKACRQLKGCGSSTYPGRQGCLGHTGKQKGDRACAIHMFSLLLKTVHVCVLCAAEQRQTWGSTSASLGRSDGTREREVGGGSRPPLSRFAFRSVYFV